ncbi:acyl transferase domain-containing protein/NADPH:quinone reductase-like Zn-dependent oxidoreductase/acyl carrier protein/short-subunit dehydrogenase [Desulfomicrobium macestii]|uniref:Acyl transferase domain-containing protein/NADPH:quinone reductase-like Zn-dependent oxidoreductase/acyl carrier protein/short-subunit dehydrogenase n=1 Tax=Desulfomicrobium macestii TaxID=90731 RepID=A0ABR9H9A1_9BACT|nr:type I polyketide synthase [Desulfomicrobium macestii]MBE1427312.1 acyl transferase domain-containing protein/NADPH:quinone reductase-like Zn-dependent oxidoreductase/acyl carrier protein/short-subunit dehydrogenase [Desulfomicrobium macestii]
MHQGIAIIGLAFRFPGDLSDDTVFWDALIRSKYLVGSIAADRWAVDELRHGKRAEPGRSVTFSAGVLSRIDQFDAGFFGISPREAKTLDPQQRLLLELSWEAMENGCVLPSVLADTDCAVYVGISGMDYGNRCMDDLAVMTSHSMTGNALSIAANRLSYVFDLHGPSLSIDTACSSSLVALHHACGSLRSGEASCALVGGVSMLLHPSPFVGFTKASMLSADGKCKAFDASGDGYVRAEGGAVLLLKPLDKALADGNSIKAVILGSGVNSDGARKSGLTIPSVEGQIELMRGVLAQSGLEPGDIDYVEAHGTGTAVGDPVEAAAIGQVYGQSRLSPLPIGSVKTNLGHLEPASGMAGLVKALLCLRNHEVPPTLHLTTPNPNIDFAGLNLEVVTRRQPLGAGGDKPLVAGVNSFGFGGTNAHVLIQEFRREDAPVEAEPRPPLFLSARTEAALRDMAGRYARCLDGMPDGHFYDVAYGAATGRERLEKRLALAPGAPQDAVRDLAAYAEGECPASVFVEDALPECGGVAFVYSGNGAQWLGMARALLAASPRFAAVVAEIDAQVGALTGFSILDELLAEEEESRLDDTVVAQPLLFAIQVGITTLLEERGIKPCGVAGHSVGEVAAAWASGALTLEQAVRVIVCRSAAQGATHGLGKMAAASISRDAALEALSGLGETLDVTIAAVNSPHMVTFAGSAGDMTALGDCLKARNVHFKLLDLEYAFHSRHMDSVRDSLLSNLGDLAPAPCARAVFVSAVTAGALDGPCLDAWYWWRNVRETVNFQAAVAGLAQSGCRVFIEIGPHAILQRYMRDTLASLDVKGRVLPTLRKNADGLERIDEVALRAHLLTGLKGADVFFPRVGREVRLPVYPWQYERHWYRSTPESLRAIERRRVHPLLGWPVSGQETAWENVLDPVVLPWLSDHKVGGAVVFPGTGYVEMGLAAARQWLGSEILALEELDILSPMVFDGEHARTVQLSLDPRDGGFRIRSRQRLSEDPWTMHAVGRVVEAASCAQPLCHVPADAVGIDSADHYRLAAELGLDYGPAFQALDSARVAGDLLEGRLRAEFQDAAGYLVHPALMDACAQSLLDFFQDEIESGGGAALLPVKTGRFVLLRADGMAGFRARLRRRGARSVLADFDLLDASGEVMAVMRDCRFRAAPLSNRDKSRIASWRVVTRPCPHPEESACRMLPDMDQLALWCREALETMEPQRAAWFTEALPLLEALVLAMAREGFEGLSEGGQGREALAGLSSSHGIWLRGLLRREGLLEFEDGQWRLTAVEDFPPAGEIWRNLLRDFPACLPQLALLGRVGLHLPRLMAEPQLKPDFLAALRRTPVAEAYYADPAYLGTGVASWGVLRGLAAGLPRGKRLRVLEAAAGPDGWTRERCRILPEDRLDYVLAFADDRALERAQAEFGDLPAVSLTGLDCAQWGLGCEDALPQMHYDVVILGHVLHRARSPRTALDWARGMLAPGGLLLVAERHPDWSADFLAGLDEGWWCNSLPDAAGGTEPVSPLLAPEGWLEELGTEGFDDVACFTEPAAGRLAEGAYLVMGRRPFAAAPDLGERASEQWLFVIDDASSHASDGLKAELESRGQRVMVAQAPVDESLAGADHVALLLGWGQAVEDSQALLSSALRCVQEIAAHGRSPRLWVVTRGGALASDLPPDRERNPAQAALWGLGRVVMNELPALRCTLIDLDAQPAGDDARALLVRELLRPDGASEIVLGADGRYSLVLVEEGQAGAQAPAERFRLDFHVPGRLRNLVWLPGQERELEAEDVEVRTRSVGLNFRDVMYLMGLLPDEAVEKGFAGASLGLEFSGVVTRVGERAGRFKPGDAVMGFGPACFSSHVVTPVHALMPMPEGWTFEAAATVPTVFLTAYYALRHLADLQPGERVLIHGGAGGVGMAAIQLARHLGAEVFVTAGNDVKRDLVRLLGADHVFDSRSHAFADDILAVTDGQGVDVVLNSLSGEAIRRNLRVLRPFGRFLELGKRDFFENTQVGLRPFKDNISYFGIDADQLLTGRPRLAARLLDEVMALFHGGVLTPLPYTVFPADRVVEAFRCMQQARHMGKIVVSLEDASARVRLTAAAPQHVHFEENATWLVTGGLAGFGLESARRLAARGVKHLVLVSRRGLDAPGAQGAVEDLKALGVDVLALACDVTDEGSLAHVLQQAAAKLPPIRGVLHAAMVLDDRLIANLDAQSMGAVLRPKLLGAWNLHNLTRDLPLEHFVLYSSITTAIGNPGQANYVAANAGLEALAQLRRQAGLPATCIGWGPIGDAGYLTRNTAVRDSLAQRLGGKPLAAAEALARLDEMIGSQRDGALANMDWAVLCRFLPSAESSRFAVLNRRRGNVARDEAELDFRALAAEKSGAELMAMVRDLVVQEVAQILSLNADRVDPERPLHDLGMDSLMAVELALGLEKRFGVQFPVMLLNESPSATRVAQRIVDRLKGAEEGGDAAPDSTVENLARQHGERMSAEEMEYVARKAETVLEQERLA